MDVLGTHRDARRTHWIPWSWSYRWWESCDVVAKKELESSTKEQIFSAAEPWLLPLSSHLTVSTQLFMGLSVVSVSLFRVPMFSSQGPWVFPLLAE